LDFGGARVVVDGIEVGHLSAQATTSLELELGQHQLTIEKSPVESRARELVYSENSRGDDRVVFSERPGGPR
jgi:hypothetical protein